MTQPPDPRVGLCAGCRHARLQRTARGSTFWRCLKADSDPGFARYRSQGVANVYIIDLTTGERTRLTNMQPGQAALFPHFRSDGWIYFMAMGAIGAGGGERVMATNAALVLAE